MNLKEIENKINEIFINSHKRQIVFWYDENKEFEEEIENIQLDNAELYILTENNWIYSKYYIESVNKEINFLVYAPFAQPDDEENYLADMVHYSTLFTADKVSLIAQELNIPSKLNSVVAEYSKFWNANSRINAFKELNIKDYNEITIVLGILAVLSKQKTTKFSYILRSVITEELGESNKIIEEFKKYGILDKFWTLISKEYKYTSTNPIVEEFIGFLLLNYTADLFEGNTPKPWEKYLVEDKNNAHIFIDEFMNNSNYSEIYDEIASIFEAKLRINSFKKDNIDSYLKCDTFETFDKNIISHYVDLLYSNKVDLGSNFKELLEYRKKTHFYSKYKDSYELLKYANLFISLINEFEREEIPEEVEEIIDIFASKWSYIDGYYRKFYYHYDKLSNTEELEELRQLIENMYVNSFLGKINPIFSKKLAEKGLNNVDVLKQWKFYKNNIPASVNKSKTAVIISDGFRYGCAVELLAELEKDPKRKPVLKPMISTIPSYTALGMAALLPNKEISYDDKTVLVDGKKCASTSERENLLKSYYKDAVAITFNEVSNLTHKDLKDRLNGANLIYVYHNKIDAIGDKAISQHHVFNAADETIKDILNIITKLRHLNYAKMFITADHGFIYKRDKLTGSSKVNLNGIKEDKNKRFIISEEPLEIPGAVSLSMDYLDLDLYANVPVGVDLFKAPGNGLNYVHGGASLQECIVPLLQVKAEKGAKNQRKVDLQLISTNNRLTNHEVMLTFFQKENISQNVLPLEAAISFVDEYDERISNEIIIYANKNSNSSEDREFKEKFTLMRKNYDKSKDYYLVIKDANDDVEITREKFIIDMAFQDGFEFF